MLHNKIKIKHLRYITNWQCFKLKKISIVLIKAKYVSFDSKWLFWIINLRTIYTLSEYICNSAIPLSFSILISLSSFVFSILNRLWMFLPWIISEEYSIPFRPCPVFLAVLSQHISMEVCRDRKKILWMAVLIIYLSKGRIVNQLEYKIYMMENGTISEWRYLLILFTIVSGIFLC